LQNSSATNGAEESISVLESGKKVKVFRNNTLFKIISPSAVPEKFLSKAHLHKLLGQSEVNPDNGDKNKKNLFFLQYILIRPVTLM
jgi:hypothetical protein